MSNNIVNIPGINLPSKPRKRWNFQETYISMIEPYLDYIIHWRRMGDSVPCIAQKLGVTEELINNCAKKNPDLYSVLQITKEHLIYELETAIINKGRNGNLDAAKNILEKISPRWNPNPKEEEDTRVILIDDLSFDAVNDIKEKYDLSDEEVKEILEG